jgi:hypothetical protein
MDQVVERIERFAGTRQLVNLKNARQTFNVWFSAGPNEGKAVFYEDETVDVTIRSEADAHLLVFNVDPHGGINLLMPNPDRKDTLIHRDEQLALKGFDIFPPFGVEYLKLFAFKREVTGLDRLARNFTIRHGSAGHRELVRVVENGTASGGDWAEASLQLVTLASEERE